MRATAATAIVLNSLHACTVITWLPCDHDTTFESWLLGEHNSAESVYYFFCLELKNTRAHDVSSALHARCMHA
jgi:hypothetical protein